jgi:hypothetical protein
MSVSECVCGYAAVCFIASPCLSVSRWRPGADSWSMVHLHVSTVQSVSGTFRLDTPETSLAEALAYSDFDGLLDSTRLAGLLQVSTLLYTRTKTKANVHGVGADVAGVVLADVVFDRLRSHALLPSPSRMHVPRSSNCSFAK